MVEKQETVTEAHFLILLSNLSRISSAAFRLQVSLPAGEEVLRPAADHEQPLLAVERRPQDVARPHVPDDAPHQARRPELQEGQRVPPALRQHPRYKCI